MTGDAPLDSLLLQFAGLARDERDFVLDLLGQAEREALRLALNENTGMALSPALASLADGCRSNRPPAELTERAAKALLTAVDAATGGDSIDEALRRVRPLPRRWLRRRPAA